MGEYFGEYAGKPIVSSFTEGSSPQSVQAIVGGSMQPIELATFLEDQEDKTVVPAGLQYLELRMSSGETLTISADTLRETEGSWQALMQYLIAGQRMLDNEGKEISFKQLLEGFGIQVQQAGEGQFVAQARIIADEAGTSEQDFAEIFDELISGEPEQTALEELLQETFEISISHKGNGEPADPRRDIGRATKKLKKGLEKVVDETKKVIADLERQLEEDWKKLSPEDKKLLRDFLRNLGTKEAEEILKNLPQEEAPGDAPSAFTKLLASEVVGAAALASLVILLLLLLARIRGTVRRRDSAPG